MEGREKNAHLRQGEKQGGRGGGEEKGRGVLNTRGGQWKHRKRSGTGADTDCPWEGTREGSRWQTARGGNLSCGAPAIMPWYGLSRSTSVYWCSRVPNLPAWCSCRAALFLLPSTLQPTLSTPAYTRPRSSKPYHSLHPPPHPLAHAPTCTLPTTSADASGGREATRKRRGA